MTAEAGEGRAADASGRAALRRPRPLLWCIPVFTVGMFLFFIQYGDYVENAVIVILMTGLLWISVSGILAMEGQPPERCRPKMLFTVTIVFCLTEYALCFSSCFWMGDTLANPYFWFDFLLSATVLLFLPALRRVVDRV